MLSDGAVVAPGGADFRGSHGGIAAMKRGDTTGGERSRRGAYALV